MATMAIPNQILPAGGAVVGGKPGTKLSETKTKTVNKTLMSDSKMSAQLT